MEAERSIIRMTNSSWSGWDCPGLKLKISHLGNPLSPEQAWMVNHPVDKKEIVVVWA